MRLAAKSFIAAGAMVACLTVPVAAEPFDDAFAAAERGDYAPMLQFLRPLADLGLATAQSGLGAMYAEGQGVTQDNAEAFMWHRLAAEQDDPNAQYTLGVMYGTGQGVPQDYVMVHMWSNLAAAQGHEEAAENRDVSAGRMTPADISEAQRLAREWKPTPE